MASNALDWTAYVQSHPTTEIKAPELAHTRLTTAPANATTPLPSYQARNISDSASIWSGTTVVGSEIEAAHPTSTHRSQAIARTRRCWSTAWLIFIILTVLAWILYIAILVGTCSRTDDFDKCMASEDLLGYSSTYNRQTHSLIKRSIESGKHDRFSWVFGGVFFGFIGFSLIVGLAYTWIMDRLRRGPRKCNEAYFGVYKREGH